jgi:hypothetical protein
MAIAATVGIGIISTPLFVSLIQIFIQGETKSLLESEIFGNAANAIPGNVSVPIPLSPPTLNTRTHQALF